MKKFQLSQIQNSQKELILNSLKDAFSSISIPCQSLCGGCFEMSICCQREFGFQMMQVEISPSGRIKIS